MCKELVQPDGKYYLIIIKEVISFKEKFKLIYLSTYLWIFFIDIVKYRNNIKAENNWGKQRILKINVTGK